LGQYKFGPGKMMNLKFVIKQIRIKIQVLILTNHIRVQKIKMMGFLDRYFLGYSKSSKFRIKEW